MQNMNADLAKNTSSAGGHAERDRATFNSWEQRVGDALRNIGDRSLLNQDPLARSSYIERLAAEKYRGRLLPRGLALHDVLLACVEKVFSEVSNEPGLARACTYLQLSVEGLTCREIGRRLNLSREHVSRVYRRKAIELVTEELVFRITNASVNSNRPAAN